MLDVEVVCVQVPDRVRVEVDARLGVQAVAVLSDRRVGGDVVAERADRREADWWADAGPQQRSGAKVRDARMD
jgi:hypothetical protein